MTGTVKWTEALVLDVLERRYARTGNGGSGEYAFLRQVRNDAGHVWGLEPIRRCGGT